MLTIPYEITFMIPKESKKGIKNIYPIDKQKFKKGQIISKYNCPEAELDTVVIKNKGFSLKLTEESNRIFYNSGKTFCKIEISHPELERFNYKKLISIRVDNLLELIIMSGNMTNFSIDGSFYFTDYSTTCCCDLGFETNSDEFKFLRKVSEAKGNGFTTKLIPGHLYSLKTGELIVYLGEVNNMRVSHNNKYSIINTYHEYEYRDIIASKSKLILKYSGANYNLLSTILNYINDNSSLTIEDFVKIIINDKEFNNLVDMCLTTSSISGADLGEIIKGGNNNDSISIDEIISDFSYSTLKSFGDYKNNVDNFWEYVTNINKDTIAKDIELSKEIKNRVFTNIKSFINNSFYNKPKCASDVRKARYYRLSSYIDMLDNNVFFDLTKDEVDKILESALQ